MTEMIKIQEQLAQLTAKVEALHADSIASKVAMMKALLAGFRITVQDLQAQPEPEAPKKRDQAVSDSFSATVAPAPDEQSLAGIAVPTSSQILDAKVNPARKRASQKAYREANLEKVSADKEAKELEKLAARKPKATAKSAAAVEPEKVEHKVRMSPEEVTAFVKNLCKMPSDIQRSLDRMTPTQKKRLEAADRAWRKKYGR